jgi:hypothetical protein
MMAEGRDRNGELPADFQKGGIVVGLNFLAVNSQGNHIFEINVKFQNPNIKLMSNA